MDNSWNVQTFLNKLKAAQAQPKSNEPKTPSLRRTYLNIQDNMGRYQIFPMISTVTGLPFEYLYRTREFNIPMITQDGQKRTVWHKLLPLTAYDFVDATGRLVSSLTLAEKNLLESAYGIFDKLFSMLPESNRKDFCRYKNYTVGNAYVINRYGVKDQTKAIESKFSTLLVCTSKDFATAVNSDIEMQKINFNNDLGWLGQIYNRELSGRTGWLIFTINSASNGIGFNVNVNHTVNINPEVTEGLVISEEDAELMKDPIRNFLGWQAGEDKLFNEGLITKIIEEMNIVISKLGTPAATSSQSMVSQATVATAQEAAPKVNMSNDPMLNQGMTSGNPNPVQSMEEMIRNNSNPYINPPAAHFDPMTQVPVNYNEGQPQGQPQVNQQVNYGYQQPSFAQAATGGTPNPFDSFQENPYRQ